MRTIHPAVVLLLLAPAVLSKAIDPDDPKQDTIEGPTEACPVDKSDTLFVVDASSSISVEKFDTMRSFMLQVIDAEFKKLGRNFAQVGLVMFSDDVVVNIPFDKYYSTNDLRDALTNLTYSRGETNLGKALEFVRTKALKPANGLRPLVPHVVILLTDGWATDIVQARREVKTLKKTGVHMLAVGIGELVDKTGLKNMVNSSEDVMFVETWKGLKDKVPALKKASCSTIQEIKRCNKNHLANVVFVVDSSSSIGDKHFKQLKSFLVNVTRAFKVIGEKGVEIALVQYSSYRRTKLIFNLDTYSDRKGIEAAINKLKWTKGSTKTGYAMIKASRWVAKKATRKGVNSTFIVVTDGKATDRVENAARRLHQKKYTVLAVGIGNKEIIDDNELKLIASKPKEAHVFRPKDFNELPNFLRYVVKGVCEPAVESKQQQEENAAEEAAKKEAGA